MSSTQGVLRGLYGHDYAMTHLAQLVCTSRNACKRLVHPNGSASTSGTLTHLRSSKLRKLHLDSLVVVWSGYPSTD